MDENLLENLENYKAQLNQVRKPNFVYVLPFSHLFFWYY